MRYLDVAEDLRSEIASGRVGPLPSEAELGEHHHVSRVTVRRALEVLRDEGLVISRRGAGWFVATDPVRQPLGRVTTIESALEAAGALPERRVLEFTFEPATPETAKLLGLGADAEVLRVVRLNLADGEPFALVTVWLPASLGVHVSRADVEAATFYELLPLHGVEAGRVVQTITATTADRQQATRLNIATGEPLLACRRITYDRHGDAVMASEHRYPAQSTALEVEFPAPHPSGVPHG
ncbi:MAG: GntR family transcriptional regulator [Acidimicrobiia bacterium]|nr:GntR family transcriptional regulator [Acidimicrobiia bacterium]